MKKWFKGSWLTSWAVMGIAWVSPNASTAQSQPTNAAPIYWLAFKAIPTDATTVKVLIDWKAVPLNADAQSVIDGGKASLDYLKRAAKLSVCDWNLDYKQGPELLLPQLNKGRELAQLACLHARLEFQKGEMTGAVDDLLNTIALARGLSTDKTMIGLLVRNGVEAMAIPELSSHLLEMQKGVLQYLKDRLEKLPPGSGLEEAIRTEATSTIQWVLTRAQNAAALGEPMDWGKLSQWMDQSGGPAWFKVREATPEELIEQANKLLPYFAQAEKIVRTSTDEQKALDALDQTYKEGSRIPLGQVFLGNFRRVFVADASGRTLMTLLEAGTAVAKDGPGRVAHFLDPVNRRAIQCRSAGAGYQLRSSVSGFNGAVTLQLGPAMGAK